MNSPRQRILPIASLIALVVAGWAVMLPGVDDALVVYCAHDSVYSEQLLQAFEEATGIPVAIRFDTEGTKSLGLVNLLLQEQRHPRCDVFWNNELLGTLDLQAAGVLHPYRGPGHARIPERYKDPDGYWTGFAGRLRVTIFNTDQLPPDQRDVDVLQSEQPGQGVFANPLYGTTRTHFTALWHQWGATRFQTWHDNFRQRGVQPVQGNAMVKNLVAAGTKSFGWTDTDDYFLAVDQQRPVSCQPVRLDSGETICIPNTVAIIRGTRRLAAAQQLVEFLLSRDTELALSQSRSRQIPLGDVDASQLTDQVRELRNWSQEAADLRTIAASRQACLQWLKSEYLR